LSLPQLRECLGQARFRLAFAPGWWEWRIGGLNADRGREKRSVPLDESFQPWLTEVEAKPLRLVSGVCPGRMYGGRLALDIGERERVPSERVA
jgi:hypothetical protein